MSKTQDDFRKLMAEVKSSWHWPLAVAGNNLQWNLYQLRKNRGWTQRELGKKLGGVAQSHIVRHETWGYMPSMDSLAKYAHVYGVTIADLLGEPMQLEPQRLIIWSDEAQDYVDVGSVEMTSTAQTFTHTLEWKL